MRGQGFRQQRTSVASCGISLIFLWQSVLASISSCTSSQALETQLYSEEVVWMRSLHIVINFLEHLPRRQKGGIPEFIQRTILTATQQQSNPAVYELAIWALGLWCHVDLVVVPTHLPIFVGALTHAELFVKEKALHCLVDVLLVWGGPAIEEQAKKSARLSTHSDGFGVSQALFQSQATDATTQSQPSEAGPDVLTQVACAEVGFGWGC